MQQSLTQKCHIFSSDNVMWDNFLIFLFDHAHRCILSFNFYTHGNNNLPMPAVAYFKNTLDSQSSGRSRGWQTFLHVVDIFYKSTTDPSFKNLQLNGFSGETLKLNLEFLCNAHIT